MTLTIKGIPKGTHRALKRRAAINRRSLNNEIIFTLESILSGAPHVVPIPQFQKPTEKFAKKK